MKGIIAITIRGMMSRARGMPQYVRARSLYRAVRIPAKPRRKGTFAGSQGVVLPSAFPALDVTIAAASGIKVTSTMMKLFRWIHERKRSLAQNEKAMAKAINDRIGTHVYPEV